MKKSLKMENEYFISLDTHMNDIRGYEEKIDDYKRIIKRLKDENKELTEANELLKEKIVNIFKELEEEK